ncbi:DUF2255 family protein [Hymenobacter sp. DG25A]|uniref:DUF2255 family protein n=1 Tax=Hymenobacter sp. DG25A TaxID=1385663 RepID=UPI0006BCEEDA|nr:DUF2255 family protein [Hymenobacter sp. DG25A]ALD21337.1 hypothetical protein AM218_09060 [Hymenobacter sp. DG25A]
MSASDTLSYISQHNLIGIRAGQDRPTFLSIWMVVVDDRIFARSWGLAEKSWFNTFMENPAGAIRCGEVVIPVRAVVPSDLARLNERISQAYLAKYDAGANSPYAQGIIQPQHVARTLEFVVEPTASPASVN